MPTNSDLNPQAGVQGTSSLYKFNSSPNTRTVVSQKTRIMTPAYGGDEGLLYQIGVMSSFEQEASSRTAEAVRGIGFGDQVAELVPGITDPAGFTAERNLLYLSNGHQAFGYAGGVSGAVRTLQQHRWPFDVEQQIVFSTIADQEAPGADEVEGLVEIDFTAQNATGSNAYDGQENRPKPIHKALITYFEACWITSMSNGTFGADGGLLSQSISGQVTDVHDLYSTYGEFMATGNDPTIGQGSSLIYSGVGNSSGVTADRNFGGNQQLVVVE